MILDLRLPAGWTQGRIGESGDAAEPGQATPQAQDLAALQNPAAAIAASGSEPSTAPGLIFWPPAEPASDAADSHEQAEPPAAALLLSPLLPLLRSPTLLLQAALDSEPDYECDTQSPFLPVRIGPWEVTVLETEGCSRTTEITSGRIYAVLDAGYAAFMLVFVDCDPRRMGLRREQLAELIVQARLRTAPWPADEEPPEPEPPAPPTAPKPETEAETEAEAEAETSTLDETFDDYALPTPPQRPAEDVYLKGNLFPHLID